MRFPVKASSLSDTSRKRSVLKNLDHCLPPIASGMDIKQEFDGPSTA
jgi:hypothetical protein